MSLSSAFFPGHYTSILYDPYRRHHNYQLYNISQNVRIFQNIRIYHIFTLYMIIKALRDPSEAKV